MQERMRLYGIVLRCQLNGEKFDHFSQAYFYLAEHVCVKNVPDVFRSLGII